MRGEGGLRIDQVGTKRGLYETSNLTGRRILFLCSMPSQLYKCVVGEVREGCVSSGRSGRRL